MHVSKNLRVEEMLEWLLAHEAELTAKEREWVRKIDETGAGMEDLEFSPKQSEVLADIYQRHQKSGSPVAKKKGTVPSKKRSAGKRKQVTIYTDGSSRGNPGPGGYGTILIFGKYRKELSQGYQRTTNNRMELMAALAGLEALFEPCEVTVHTDSKYLAEAFQKHWIVGWKRKGWKTASKKPVKNKDLWLRLDAAAAKHEVHWKWVKGHAGHLENERCDTLATTAADGGGRIPDKGYEESLRQERGLFDD